MLLEIKPNEELYDLQNDPHEVNNLADDPKHGDIKTQLAATLDQWIKSTGDTGLKELSRD